MWFPVSSFWVWLLFEAMRSDLNTEWYLCSFWSHFESLLPRWWFITLYISVCGLDYLTVVKPYRSRSVTYCMVTSGFKLFTVKENMSEKGRRCCHGKMYHSQECSLSPFTQAVHQWEQVSLIESLLWLFISSPQNNSTLSQLLIHFNCSVTE